MTTTSDPAAITITIVTEDGTRVITAHTGKQVRSMIDRLASYKQTKPFIVKARGADGVGTLGMYCEIVHRTPRGTAARHTRYFVYGNVVYAASRSVGDSKANWKQRHCPSLEAALNIVQAAFCRDDNEQFGRIVLVEMTADDISAIEAGQIPGARFRGQYRNERDFGKFDFARVAPGVPVKHQEVPQAVRNELVRSH